MRTRKVSQYQKKKMDLGSAVLGTVAFDLQEKRKSSGFKNRKVTIKQQIQQMAEDESISSHSFESCSSYDMVIDKIMAKLKEGEGQQVFQGMLKAHKEDLVADMKKEFGLQMEKHKAENVEIITYLENQVSILLRKCNDLRLRIETMEEVTY